MENSKKSGISRVAIDFDLNSKLKALAIKKSKPGHRVTIEALVSDAVRALLKKEGKKSENSNG